MTDQDTKDAMEMLGAGYDHPELPEGFNSPNYTQSPNDFYDHYLKQIETLAELKVVCAFIRFTFGFHRGAFRMGIGELAEYTGLSQNSVRAGAEAAEKRKLLRRTNRDENTSAEWELFVQTPLQGLHPPLQTLKGSPAKFEVLSPVKETVKEKTWKHGDLVDATLELAQSPGMKKTARIESILSYLGTALRVNSETKRWKEFAAFADERQQIHGEKLNVFIDWMKSQRNFDLQYWPPSKMREMWPGAFVPSKPEAPREETELAKFMREHNDR